MPVQSNFVFVPFHAGDPQGTVVYLRDAGIAIGTPVSNGDFSATPTTLVYRSGDTITVVRNWR